MGRDGSGVGAAGFAADLWDGAAQAEGGILAHPFLRGLADGSLPLSRFVTYLRQDHVFLTAYARVLGLAVGAADDAADAAVLAGLLVETITVEADAQRKTCAALGVDASALDATVAAPFTSGYAGHLLAVARGLRLGVTAASLLPCQWGYARIGRRLAGERSPVPAYAAWIDGYASEAYQRSARWVWDLVDRTGAAMPPPQRADAERAFAESMCWERVFWDGCWAGDAP